MRRNLTISLSLEDWRQVQAMVHDLAETYSGVFHRLIQATAAGSIDRKKIAKYRSLLAPHASFLADRARLMAKSRGRASPPAA